MSLSQLRQRDWRKGWDAEVGLWVQEGAGHTRPTGGLPRVHPAPNAASRLVLAAQVGEMAEVEPQTILRALRGMQSSDGAFKWYWEESHPVDGNASFFTGMGLITLRKCYAKTLDDACVSLLDEILIDLHRHFAHKNRERRDFYPNAYLGDIACEWVLTEMYGSAGVPPAVVLEALAEAADYWQTHHWGWGEHMSDGYGKVCLDQLSMLLLFSDTLPEALRTRYTALLAELLAIEDAFDDGPRVPALRSYSFLNSPTHRNYRDTMDISADCLTPEMVHNVAPMWLTYREIGWDNIVPPRARRAAEVTIPCFGSATATALIEDDVRLGCMSHFPLMPSAEHPIWGLSWQCFPVALWRNEGDWGFLQWETREGERVRSHPSNDISTTYLGNALSQSVLPPPVGRTWGLRHGGNVLVLRVMPVIPASWDRLADRFRLVKPHGEYDALPADGPWSQLLLRYPEREISVQHVALTGDVVPAINTGNHANCLDWECAFSAEALADRRLVVSLWGISLDGRVTQPPCLTPAQVAPLIPREKEEHALQLTWEWPGVTWRVRIDPLAGDALVELE